MSQIYKNITGQFQTLSETETVLIRGARQLVTLNGPAHPRRGAQLGDLSIINDGALLIRDGRIIEAGPTRRVENLAPARRALEIDATGRVVMPGLVDSRVQLWPESPDSSRALPVRTLATNARKVLSGMARHGTTTVCAGTSAARDHSTELKIFRVLGGLNGKPLDVLTAYVGVIQAESGGDAAARVESLCTEMMPVVWRRKLARFAVVNCEAFEPAEARQLLKCARKLGFQLCVWAGSRTFAVPLAVEVEALSVALDDITNEEIRILARSRTIAQLQPASQFLRRSERQPNARALIESGAAIALDSGFGLEDGPTYNMQMVLSLACSEMRMSPAEAISAATINAAYALACGAECGSLQPGKRADVLLMNVEDYRDVPYRFGVNHTHMVFKKGAAIYQEGEVTHWDGK